MFLASRTFVHIHCRSKENDVVCHHPSYHVTSSTECNAYKWSSNGRDDQCMWASELPCAGELRTEDVIQGSGCQ